jgi:hypothetical protein
MRTKSERLAPVSGDHRGGDLRPDVSAPLNIGG